MNKIEIDDKIIQKGRIINFMGKKEFTQIDNINLMIFVIFEGFLQSVKKFYYLIILCVCSSN